MTMHKHDNQALLDAYAGGAAAAKYGEAYLYNSTGDGETLGIDAKDQYHGMSLDATAGTNEGFTYLDGQANAIASVAENSAGVSYKVTTTGNHNLTAGEPITQTGFAVQTAYNGVFIVQSVPSATEYIVLGTYVDTDTGFMKRGFTLRANTGSAGIYKLNYDCNLKSASGTNTEFKVDVYVNGVLKTNLSCRRSFTQESRGWNQSGIITLANGDYVWLSAMNLYDAGDVKVSNANLNLFRLNT